MPKLNKPLSFVLLWVSALILFQANSATAATFHVDPANATASDSNSGSAAKPWVTLKPTTEKSFSPGDVIVVHAGVYTSPPGSVNEAVINPQSSGRSHKPITFISRPRHAAILEGQAGNLAAINITSQNYIVIDGFKISEPGTAGIVVNGDVQKPVYGVVIRNNIISLVRNKYAAENTDGIRLVNTAQTKIVNNKITDIEDGAKTANAAAIKLYNVDRINIENNNLTNVTSGIFVRANGSNIRIKRNFISTAEYAIKVSNTNKSRLRYIEIENNIFKEIEIAVQLIPDGGTVDKVNIKNNVFLNYSVAALQATQPGMGTIKVWNNIFDHGDISYEFIADVFTFDDPPISLSLMDYNLFASKPVFINGLYNTNRRFSGLSSWKQYNELDRHSLVASPDFKSVRHNNFRLKNNSVAINRGRVDGNRYGKKVNLGAYDTPKTIVGYRRSGQKTTKIASTKTKKKSTSKKPSKTKKSSTKKKTTTQSKSSKQVATSKSVKNNTSKKKIKTATVGKAASTQTKTTKSSSNTTTTSKSNSSVSSSSSQKPIVVSSIYPDAKPRKKNGLSKLEWDVRNALKYKGACVLESNKVYFYDGHDNTGLKFRLLNDSLYLITKSNIDISFKDIGIKMSSGSFFHADSVVDDQTVLIKKELPDLLIQLRKSDMAKVQLRFWPTYPATQTYSEDIVLSGFKEAYQEYKSCKKGN